MQGYLSLVLHAHLPFVRHPEHARFLEESWLYEAITETYLPLIEVFDGWLRDGMETRLTICLSPTVCAMLLDPLLQDRYTHHLNALIDLADKEVHRTMWDAPQHEVAIFYRERFERLRSIYFSYGRNIVGAFRKFQEAGRLEIITTAATHAVLPLISSHPPSIRAQILVARDFHRECFGRAPRGMWLPECAYAEGVENVLQEANIRWFITDTHGILHATPRPRYGVFAPIFTNNAIAAFGRDLDSAKQVWSKHEGYPGDPRYRDFYRDVGFDLDYDYVRPHLPSEVRTFTGIKYHAITGSGPDKLIYNRRVALETAAQHAQHFMEARVQQISRLAHIMDRPPIILSPYDAELFGHWWYEGPEFLDYLVRKITYDQHVFGLTTPQQYLQEHPTQQVAQPSASSWGEEGYWKVWLNEKNEWILPHLDIAQQRMTELAQKFRQPDALTARALKQAGRELLLAQSSDWPFILRTGTSPDYARRRVKDHLLRFIALHEQLTQTQVDEPWLADIESRDNLFPGVRPDYWS